MKILIVDDEIVSRMKMFKIMMNFGDCDEAEGGAEAIESFTAAWEEWSPYDLITLDISMDRESGIKMYRNLHDSAETADIPVIIITGVSPELKTFIARRKQVDPPFAFLEKPVEQEQLLQKVKDALG